MVGRISSVTIVERIGDTSVLVRLLAAGALVEVAPDLLGRQVAVEGICGGGADYGRSFGGSAAAAGEGERGGERQYREQGREVGQFGHIAGSACCRQAAL